MHLPIFSTSTIPTSTFSKFLQPGNVDCISSYTPAPAADVVACNDQIKAKGDQECVVSGLFDYDVFCTYGRATVGGVLNASANGNRTSIPCIEIAQAVGHIMDDCTSDKTVKGVYRLETNPYIDVWINYKSPS
ncbi:hypothetical protein DOTSEDRAFT_23731 [Dothistroma septosporum NZE10]|uniref:Ecp2 effector protein domain-containing protein n=1 Tax=Dothistroma septosporum (strain NZE10 / CBS 128990) TaxID=675120 RepID=N1PQS9_DOTSN|nr:hypothetical protein DOTSEDRAFT_23731 [Dothistroma septosporum NZE10]